jgi:hypothetical protein
MGIKKKNYSHQIDQRSVEDDELGLQIAYDNAMYEASV